MPYCTHCGAKVRETDLFCPKCGTPIVRDAGNNLAGEQVSTTESAPADISPQTAPELEYKGVGIRFLAQIFDAIPIFIFFFVVGSYIASGTSGETAEGFELHGAPALALILLTVVFSVLYFTILEAWWDGQSIGKKILRIKVVNEDGSKIDLSTSFVRNALRLVDGFMGYLVGAIFIWRSGKKQRLGDRLAGTVVIKKVKRHRKEKKKTKLVFGEKDPSMIDTFD